MSYIHYSIQLLGAECPVYVRHFLNPTIQEWRYMSNMGTWLIELTFQSKSLSMSKQRDVKDDSRHYVDVIIIDYLMWHFPCIRVRTSFYDYKWLENFWIFSTCYYQTRKRISPNILKGRDWKKIHLCALIKVRQFDNLLSQIIHSTALETRKGWKRESRWRAVLESTLPVRTRRVWSHFVGNG